MHTCSVNNAAAIATNVQLCVLPELITYTYQTVLILAVTSLSKQFRLYSTYQSTIHIQVDICDKVYLAGSRK